MSALLFLMGFLTIAVAGALAKAFARTSDGMFCTALFIGVSAFWGALHYGVWVLLTDKPPERAPAASLLQAWLLLGSSLLMREVFKRTGEA